MSGRNVLLTGAAGFVGFHVAQRLLDAGQRVIGIDNINDFYSQQLKQDRLEILQASQKFEFQFGDIADQKFIQKVFDAASPDLVIHLAAQASVRYSLQNPRAYVNTNLNGFFNVLQASTNAKVKHFVFASSSSVYGANRSFPLIETDPADHPMNLYAATKRSNELIAHSYSHLYGLPATALRFFTVYGPWGRPDMAYYKFARAIASGDHIEVYNNGEMWRDFTYIDDVVEGIARILDIAPAPAEPPAEGNFPLNTGPAPFMIYNIGGNKPEKLMDMIELLEKHLGRKAKMIMRPMQPGEIQITYADTDALCSATGFQPQIGLDEGIRRFAEWFKTYHKD